MHKTLPNCYLVGFMATGKTTIGRYLAKELGLAFIDSDEAIEQAEGMAITELITQKGEPYFRQAEARFVETGHAKAGQLVACGGGLIAQAGMPAKLLAQGLIVGLEAEVETILKRTQGDTTRPLLQGPNPRATVAALLRERAAYYAAAQLTLSTDDSPPELLAHLIANWYRRQIMRPLYNSVCEQKTLYCKFQSPTDNGETDCRMP